MRFANSFAITAVALVLTACGGGGGGSAATTTNAPVSSTERVGNVPAAVSILPSNAQQ